MRLDEFVWHLLLSPLYLLIFLIFTAPGLIKGTLDIVTAPFVVAHEESHLRTARLLNVEYQQINALTWKFPNASGREVLAINLAPLLLILPSLVLFEVSSLVTSWWSAVLLLVAVGVGRYSLPSRMDLLSIRSKYTFSIAHVLLFPLVFGLYLIRIPRRFSVLLDYLVEIAWVAFLFVSVEYWGVVWSVVSARFPF